MTTPPKAPIYTRTGDQGKTRLVTGECISKSDPRVVAYGTVDELNAVIGFWRSRFQTLFKNSVGKYSVLQNLEAELEKIQNHLFNLGSRLATKDESMLTQMPALEQTHITFLEKSMDLMTVDLPTLKEFIIPGGDELAAIFHMCRTVCRRAEREAIPMFEASSIYQNELIYLNRLSDYFFTASRWVNVKLGLPDHTWKKDL